jgi:hypothetical protein
VRCSAKFQFPSADKRGEAIYSSWSLGFHHLPTNRFVWYETSIFDYKRPIKNAVFMDSISGNAIVHGALSASNPSSYHTQSPGCADSSSSTWAGYKLFNFTISAAEFSNGIKDVNARFGTNISITASEWALGHFNVEVEGTGEGRAGMSVQNLRIEFV